MVASRELVVPERLRSVRGTSAVVSFADGTPAGRLGEISDRGFELITDAGSVLVDFAALSRVEQGVVELVCSRGDLPAHLVPAPES